jgi:hypothetical protein
MKNLTIIILSILISTSFTINLLNRIKPTIKSLEKNLLHLKKDLDIASKFLEREEKEDPLKNNDENENINDLPLEPENKLPQQEEIIDLPFDLEQHQEQLNDLPLEPENKLPQQEEITDLPFDLEQQEQLNNDLPLEPENKLPNQQEEITDLPFDLEQQEQIPAHDIPQLIAESYLYSKPENNLLNEEKYDIENQKEEITFNEEINNDSINNFNQENINQLPLNNPESEIIDDLPSDFEEEENSVFTLNQNQNINNDNLKNNDIVIPTQDLKKLISQETDKNIQDNLKDVLKDINEKFSDQVHDTVSNLIDVFEKKMNQTLDQKIDNSIEEKINKLNNNN